MYQIDVPLLEEMHKQGLPGRSKCKWRRNVPIRRVVRFYAYNITNIGIEQK